jgi:hypothetical protein
MALDNQTIYDGVKATSAILQAKVDSAVQDLVNEANRLSDPWDFVEQDRKTESVTDHNPLSAPVIPEFTKPVFVFNPEDYVTGNLDSYRYDSEFFKFLDPKLREYIEEETTGISADIQQALFDLMYERDLQTLNDALDAVDRKQAQRGFPIPTSMMLAARNDVIKKYQDTRNDRNREVTALIAERAQANVHHAIDSGLKMEDINSRFQLEYFKTYFVMADSLIRKYAVEMEAAIKEFEANATTAVKKYETDKANWELDMKEDAIRIERLGQYINQEKSIADALIRQSADAAVRKLEASRESVNYYKSAVSSALGQINAVNVASTTT